MEYIPPSYEAAVARDPWQLIADYIPSSSLCALTRVNRDLNKKFSPFLWGNPAAHFAGEYEDVGSEHRDKVFGTPHLSWLQMDLQTKITQLPLPDSRGH